MLRCKLRVESVTQRRESDLSISQEDVTLRAVYGPDNSDNANWSKYTPSATFHLTITNPGAYNKLISGREYFIDISEAPIF